MHCRGECDVPGCRATLRLHVDLARALQARCLFAPSQKSRTKAPGPRVIALYWNSAGSQAAPPNHCGYPSGPTCACLRVLEPGFKNSSRAVTKVKQTRVIFPFSSTSKLHLPSQTNSRDHNRRAINNRCCDGRLFLLLAASSSGCCNPAGARDRAAC